MFLYAVSLVKFFLRDPLGADVGPQGPIELALLIMAGFTLLTTFHRRTWKLLVAPSAKAFMAFGALAALSSAFSYYPLLSFVKGLSFLLVCGIAVVAVSAFGSAQVIKYLYYSILIVLLAGLVLKFAGGGPLMAIDEYSGRARFTMFALHPAMLADLCAVTLLLSSFLMSKRPPLYFPAFLFAINIAAGSRAGSALLVVVLLCDRRLASVRLTSRPSGLLFVGSCAGFLLVLTTVGQGIQEAKVISPISANHLRSANPFMEISWTRTSRVSTAGRMYGMPLRR